MPQLGLVFVWTWQRRYCLCSKVVPPLPQFLISLHKMSCDIVVFTWWPHFNRLTPVSFSIECPVCIVFVHTVSEIFLDILQEVSGLSHCKCCFAPEVVRAFHSWRRMTVLQWGDLIAVKTLLQCLECKLEQYLTKSYDEVVSSTVVCKHQWWIDFINLVGGWK